jgi:VCBS repeat-containing protein
MRERDAPARQFLEAQMRVHAFSSKRYSDLVRENKKRRTRRLLFEQFEDRCVLALAVDDSYSITANQTLSGNMWANDSYNASWESQSWGCVESEWHDGYYDDPVWHDGYYDDPVWHDGYYDENNEWHDGYYDDPVWHDGYNDDPVWHDGYSECLSEGWITTTNYVSGSLNSLPSHGIITQIDGGNFTYTPNNDYAGYDSFVYAIADDAGTGTATVMITVDGPPTATDDEYSTGEDEPLTVTAPGLLTNDTDPESDSLTAIFVSGPAHGTLDLTEDGSFVYTPATHYIGIDSFTYQCNDGQANSNVAIVVITVSDINDPPTLNAISNPAAILEDAGQQTVNLSGISAGPNESQNLTVTAVSNNTGLIPSPSITYTSAQNTGSIAYTPVANQWGTAVITVTVTDDGGTANSGVNSFSRTFTVNVTAVNDAPTLDAISNPSPIPKDAGQQTVNLSGITAGPGESQALIVAAQSQNTGLIPNPTVTYTSANSTGALAYTPVANQYGTAVIIVTVTDNGGTANGGVDSFSRTFTVTVTAANEPPVAVNDSYSTWEDHPLRVKAPGVLANDNVSGVSALVDAGPGHGTLTLGAGGAFSYTPALNYYGTDSFTYKVTDGSTTFGLATVTLAVNSVNDYPVSGSNIYNISEDTTLTAAAPGLLANDSDVESSVTFFDGSWAEHGTVVIGSNGSFTYTPSPNFRGLDRIRYWATDGTNYGNAAYAYVNVASINDAPAATTDSFTAPKNGSLIVAAPALLGNDTDADEDSLSAVLVDAPVHGTLSMGADGRFTYTPAANYSGADSFTYRANDGTATSGLATVSFNVVTGSVAVANAYSATEDVPLTVAAAGVLSNDIGSSLTAVLDANAAHGTVNLASNGSFTYTPSGNFNGMDSFTYHANDGQATNTTTVWISVAEVNDAPTLFYPWINGVSLGTYSGWTMDFSGVGTAGVIFYDPEGDPLTFEIVSGFTHGTLTTNPDGTYHYVPDSGYSNWDVMTFRVSDGQLYSDNKLIYISIGALGVSNSYTTPASTALVVSAPGLLANDLGSSLTAAVQTDPAHGTLSLGSNGAFTYTPTSGYNGPDSFSYSATGPAGGYYPVTVAITVGTCGGCGPVARAGTLNYTNEDLPISRLSPGVLWNDTTATGNAPTAELVTLPAHGTLNFSANGGYTYAPDPNFHGQDWFTYRAVDGSAVSAETYVYFQIAEQNDAPNGVGDSYAATEDTPRTIAAAGVLANDSDVDFDDLNAVLLAGPAHGSVALKYDGSFTFTPVANYFGTDSFTYRAWDGDKYSAATTVTLSISGTPDAPVAAGDSYAATEDALRIVAAPGVLTNDADPDGDSLTAAVVTGPAHGTFTLGSSGAFTYSPAAGYDGTDSFTYRASDGSLTSNTVTVTLAIAPANHAPTATGDTYTATEDFPRWVKSGGVLSNDTDVEGDTLTAVLAGSPAHGTITLASNGTFTYRSSLNYNGTDSFTYRASDGMASSGLATVTITVYAINDYPISGSNIYNMSEDATLTVAPPGFLSNDSDVEGESLTVSYQSYDAPVHGTVTVGASGNFTYRPAANFRGLDSFRYRVYDSYSSGNDALVYINVANVNDAPAATSDTFRAAKNGTLTVVAPSFLGNDSDIDSDALTATLVGSVSHGSLAIGADGRFTYTPSANYTGADSFTYRAHDGTTTSGLATVTLNVVQAAVAVPDIYSATEDSPRTISASGVLSNDAGSSLTAVLDGNAAHGTVVLGSNGSFTYTPAGDFNGLDSFTYHANDGQATNTTTVWFNVAGVNDAPKLITPTTNGVSVNLAAGSAWDFSGEQMVQYNFYDPEGDPISFEIVSGFTYGTLTTNPDGTYHYAAPTNFAGWDILVFRASDGQLSSTSTQYLYAGVTAVSVANSYTTAANTPLTVNSPGVLANDLGSSLTASLSSGPSHGTLNFGSNGSFTYTPTSGYNGPDSFTYTAAGPIGGNYVATVAITVGTCGSCEPVARSGYFNFTSEDEPFISPTPGMLRNDTTATGNAPTAEVLSPPAHGTLNFSTSGGYTYTPDANYHGLDWFTYRAVDGQAVSDPVSIYIQIIEANDAPVAVGDSYSTTEDIPLTVSAVGILANDSDLDFDDINAILVAGPAHGSLDLKYDGNFTYTPSADYFGIDSFTYRAWDGQAYSAPTTVTLSVAAVNDAPVAISDVRDTPNHTPLTVASPGVLTNDTDAENDALTATLVAGPAHGTLAFSSNGSFTYAPTGNYAGPDSFTYRANDGQVNSNTATVSISVGTAPELAITGFSSNGTNLEIDYSVANGAAGSFKIALYTSDDGLTLGEQLQEVNGGQNPGSLGNHTLTFQPTFDDPAENYYLVAVLDSNDEVLESDETNNAAVFSGGAFVAEEANSGLTVVHVDAKNTVTTTSLSKVGSTTLRVTQGGQSHDYSIAAIDEVHYRGHQEGDVYTPDPTLDLPIWTFIRGPAAQDASYQVPANSGSPLEVSAEEGVLSGATDDDGEELAAVLVGGPGHGTLTLNGDGSFDYTPTENYAGPDSFTYKACHDSVCSNPAKVTIDVTEPAGQLLVSLDWHRILDPVAFERNILVVLSGPDGFSMNHVTNVMTFDEDHNVIFRLPLNDTDYTLTVTPSAGLTLSGNPTTIQFNSSRVPYEFGFYHVNYVVLSNAWNRNPDGTIPENYVPIPPGDYPPLAAGDIGGPIVEANNQDPKKRLYWMYEDGELDVQDADHGVLADNAVDFEADPWTDFTATIAQNPLHGTVTLNSDGSFFYKPTLGFWGLDFWRFYAVIGGVQSLMTTAYMTVDQPTVDSVDFIYPQVIDWTGVPDDQKAANLPLYGDLSGDNPTGDPDDRPNVVAINGLSTPAFEGGDRIFPDALPGTTNKGRNVVRVRARVSDDTPIGKDVFFRSFDVDDPSNDPLIDRNNNWNDNRGRLAGTVNAPADSVINGGSGFQGRLRPVNTGAGAIGGWGGSQISAKVKLINLGTVENPLMTKVAEVDLAVSFAPGDNFRVGASFLQADVNGWTDKDVPTTGEPDPNKKLTAQLSVWRHLYIEDDSVTPLVTESLMQSTTNRLDNRFADAYIEPAYFDPPNDGTALVTPHQATLMPNFTLSGPDQTAIAAAMDTKDVGATKVETDVFWVAYIGGGWSLTGIPGAAGIMGLAANRFANKPYDWSMIFDPNIATLFNSNPAAIPKATAKTAIHEIGHQLLRPGEGRDRDGHRGVEDDVTKYYNSIPNGKKTGTAWARTVNIMNKAALQVPMDNPTASIPVGQPLGEGVILAIAGNNAGPYDRYFFYSIDVVTMRSRRHSPGRG